MSFLRRLFGGADTAGEPPDEPEQDTRAAVEDSAGEPLHEDRHAVSVWLRLSDASFTAGREQMRMYALEDRLIAALDAAGVGTYDTNELAHGWLTMRMLGPDGDAIVAAIRKLLVAESPPGSYLAVRRGPSGTSEERVEISS